MYYDNVIDRFEHGALYQSVIVSCDDDPDPGVFLDAMIERLEARIPNIMMMPHTDDLVPLMADENGTLHPVFAGQEIPDLAICRSPRSFKKNRLPLRFFTEENHEIYIVIFDQLIEEPVSILAYRELEYKPECWEMIRRVTIPTIKIPGFIRLAREIQYARLESLFDAGFSETPQ